MIGLGANAQSWTIPSLSGEDPVSGTQYKVMNVGANKYLDMGKSWFGWSTTAILSDNGINFTMTADGDNWKFIRTGNQGVFTSGNSIPGDAMHVDNTAHTYGITKMPNGNYQIHDVVDGEYTTCWGYIEHNSVWGPVAHANASTIGTNGEWMFVTPASISLYYAKLKLYNLLLTAKSEDVNTDAAGTVYNNASATVAELDAACAALNLLRMNKFLEGKTASKESPIDVTEYLLINPDFEVATANGKMPSGWTITITGQNCGQMNRTDTNSDTGLSITNFIEAWHPSKLGAGVIAQTVESLPEGTYILECDASVCHDPASGDGTDIKGAFLFIKSSLKTEKEAVGNVRLGIKHYSVAFSHGGDGEVQFGLMATDDINANWLSADNFKILYAGDVDPAEFKAALDEAVADFEALESSVDAKVYANLKTQVDALNITYSTSSEIKAAIANVLTINEYATAYAAATAARDNATYANVTGSEKTALNEAIADAPTYADYSTYAAKTTALTSATSTFKAAAPAYDTFAADRAETAKLFGEEFANSVPTPNTAAEAPTVMNIAQYNKVKSDYTYSLNGLIGDFGSWEGTATVGGNPAEPNFLDSQHWSGTKHAYYEQAAEGYGSDNGWTIKYEKKCTLPAGSYVIKVAARSSGGTTSLVSCSATENKVTLPNVGGEGNKGINKAGEASWTDGEFAANGNGYGWQWRFLPFTLTEKTEVTMTFYAEASVKYQWMSIADGELLSANDVATAVAYNEATSNTIAAEDIANVTITREIKVGYNTVVLPFVATANQVADAFGTGTEVYEFSENSDDAAAATVNFKKGDGSISANVPVLIKATEASSSQVFKGVKIVAPTADIMVAGKNFNFVGTYAPIANIAAGDYFVGNGALYKSAGATKIDAFRAYIKVKPAADPEARIVNFVIDGIETTAIEGIQMATLNNNKIYNLNGQQVKNAKKGLYIMNGKKVVVK